MKKRLTLTLSFVLVIVFIWNSINPVVFANYKNDNFAVEMLDQIPLEEKELLQMEIFNPMFTNYSELPSADQELVRIITSKPDMYLAMAEVSDGKSILIYNTTDINVKIANTDGYLEVISRIDKNTFVINGEIHRINYKFEVNDEFESKDIASLSSWIKTSDPGGSWTYKNAGWHNLHFENAIANYTLGALATIISFFVNPLAGIVTGIASMFLNSQFTNTSVAKVYKIDYDHSTLPMLYKSSSYHAYAVYQGQDHYLGAEREYYSWAPNL